MNQVQDLFQEIRSGEARTVAESVKLNTYLSRLPNIQLYNTYLNYLIIGSKKDIYSMFNRTDRLTPLMLLLEKFGGVYCKIVFNADEKLVYRHMICVYTPQLGSHVFLWGGLFDAEIQPDVLQYILNTASDEALKELLRFTQFNDGAELQGNLIEDLPWALNDINNSLINDMNFDLIDHGVHIHSFCEIPDFLCEIEEYGEVVPGYRQ